MTFPNIPKPEFGEVRAEEKVGLMASKSHPTKKKKKKEGGAY